VAALVKRAVAEDVTIREAALPYVERGSLTLEQLDAALDVLAMTRPQA
jgi:fumarate hydratase class II